MVAQELPKYRYRVDEADVLVWVDDWWVAFARENGAGQLNRGAVLGHSLWEYVAGEETRRWYGDIHARVRATGEPMLLVFRCDSPTLQRHMRMTIARDRRQLIYECTLVKAEPQRRLNLLDAQHPRSDAFLTVCSACRRALLEPAGWLDVEEVATRLRLHERKTVPELRYAVCPRCIELTTRN